MSLSIVDITLYLIVVAIDTIAMISSLLYFKHFKELIDVRTLGLWNHYVYFILERMEGQDPLTMDAFLKHHLFTSLVLF